jgi:hypothetical protein
MKKKPRKRQPKKNTRNRARRPNALERATAAYFASLSGEVLEEERRLEAAITSTPGHIDFEADYD